MKRLKLLVALLVLASGAWAQYTPANGATPSGAASGDLSGSYPNPTVAKVNGAVVPTSAPLVGTNSSKQIILASPFATNAQAATYQALAADFSGYKTIIVASGTFTITLVASGAQPATGQGIRVINYGSGVVTIARSGQNINGGTASLTLAAASATAATEAFVVSDGTNYFAAVSGGGPFVTVATFAALATGLVKNTTSTGALSIAVVGDVTGLFTGCTGLSVVMTSAGSCATPKSQLAGNTSGNSIAASTTSYLGLGNTSPATSQPGRYFFISTTGTLKNFYLNTSSTQNAGGSMVCAFTQNGTTPTALAVTVTAGSGAATFSDLSDSLAVTAGDLISLQCVNNYSGGNSAIIGAWSVGLY